MKRSPQKTTVTACLSRQHRGISVAEIIFLINSPHLQVPLYVKNVGGTSIYTDVDS